MVVAYKLRSGRVMRSLCYKHICPGYFRGFFFGIAKKYKIQRCNYEKDQDRNNIQKNVI
jgi:hypothetical protein